MGVLECLYLYLVEHYGSYRLDGLPRVKVSIPVGDVGHDVIYCTEHEYVLDARVWFSIHSYPHDDLNAAVVVGYGPH